MERASGLLLHVTSLPQEASGGSLGRGARRFIDFCARARQRYWQVLPFHPPDPWGSPYAALSAFAGDDALLPNGTARVDAAEFDAFCKREAAWLEDYALFRALRAAHDGAAWTEWPIGLRDRTRSALTAARSRHAEAVLRHKRRQFVFDRDWRALRTYGAARGVELIGDMPLFVAHDSADVWAHRSLFRLQRNGKPSIVTGVPPDYFNAEGQRWGNPHYDWRAMRRARFAWWVARLRRLLALVAVVRVDHFLGLVRAWEIAARAKTGRRGTFAPAPGDVLLSALRDEFGALPLIAEDLGLVTDEAHALRRQFGLPGMKVMHFSFGPNPADRPHTFDRDTVVYTGTHDNDTTVGWARSHRADAERALTYVGGTRRDLAWNMVRAAWTSPAQLAIAPVQDLLGLGQRARMNTPGAKDGNWRWRLQRGQLKAAHARRLAALTEVSGR